MPEVIVDGVRLHYVDLGQGPETVVFSHSYLVDHRHFEAQIAALSKRYRVIAYDHRGHGASDKPRDGYTMERLYADGVGLVEALDCGPVHWVGLSTGGFVGMRMAARRPELVKSLSLMDTSAEIEPAFHRIKYRALFLVLGLVGFGPVLGAAMKALFGPTFLKDPARAADRARWRDRIRDNDVPAIIAFGKAIFGREDVSAALGGIARPTLVVVGADDQATPPSKARALTDAIPGARLEVIARAGHLCTVEEPEAVTKVLEAFLAEQTA